MSDLPIKKILISDLAAFDSSNLTDTFSDGEKFVVFSFGNELFAVSAQKVSEVVQPLEITSLPNVPEWLSGICNLRGEIVSVVNLPKLWKRETPTNFVKPKLIILRGQNGAIALATDRLSEIVSLPDEAIEPCEKDSYIYANAVHDEKNLNLIDAEKLFFNLSEQPA